MAPPTPAPDRRPLVERTRPLRPPEILGQERALADLAAWADGWSDPSKPPRFRAAILIGPPGVGKTTAALAIARERGWTTVEMNASDARNERAIQEVAGRASLSMTLGDSGAFRTPARGGRTLILLDEADCLSGRRVEESAASRPTSLSFREFVRGRYGSVGELNRAWRLGEKGRPKPFEELSEIPLSGGRAAWTKLAEAQRDLDEWRGAARPRDRSDRGGMGAIASLVQSTRQPLVLTVNDFEPLRRYSPVFQRQVARILFPELPPAAIRTLLERTARREGWTLGPEALEAIVRRSLGDARAALNDLEAIHLLPAGISPLSTLAVRDRSAEFRELTEEVLSAGRYYRNVEVRERLDAPPDELFPWIEENLPRFAGSARGTAAALVPLARAEHLLARARRFRVYSLWSYASELMTGGVGISIASTGGAAASRAEFPFFLAQMGGSRLRRGERDALARKAGRRLHVSVRKSREIFLPFLERWLAPRGHGPAMAGAPARIARLARELDLTEAELEVLGASLPEGVLPPGEEPESAPAPPDRSSGASGERTRQRRLGDFGA